MMAELEDKLEHNAPGENLVGFFEHWLVRHVLAHDREYARYMKGHFPALGSRQHP